MRKRAAVIGVFDGVHAGHRHLLDQLKREARERGLEPVAVTFDRHPMELVAPESVPPRICTVGERAELLRAEGVEPILLEFTPGMRAMTAREFLSRLRTEAGVELLLMGFNNRIGSDRRAGAELSDSPVEIVVASELPEAGASSSAVRRAVSLGDMERAAALLGRRFALEGEVVSGRQVGRTIGFPTANISVASGQLVPPNGVYEARAGKYRAVVNIGRRPTLDNGDDVTIEAHLLGFEGNLYGKRLRVEFVRRLRPEMKFGSLEELKLQIERDIESVLHGK